MTKRKPNQIKKDKASTVYIIYCLVNVKLYKCNIRNSENK